MEAKDGRTMARATPDSILTHLQEKRDSLPTDG